jgi:hypothetical protein
VSGSVGPACYMLLFILENFFMYFVKLNNIYSVYSEYMHDAHDAHVQ